MGDRQQASLAASRVFHRLQSGLTAGGGPSRVGRWRLSRRSISASWTRGVWPGPPAGTLSFFCYIGTDSFYVDRGGSALVLLHPPGTELCERDFPEDLPEDLRFPDRIVGVTPAMTLPWIGVGPAQELAQLGLDAMHDRKRSEAWNDLALQVRGREHQRSPDQMLGWPRFVQDDIAYSWPRLHEDAVRSGVGTEPTRTSDWRLLLQVSGLEALRVDNGGLFFGVPAADLAVGRFDRVEARSDSG
jgi:hypothetical protein